MVDSSGLFKKFKDAIKNVIKDLGIDSNKVYQVAEY